MEAPARISSITTVVYARMELLVLIVNTTLMNASITHVEMVPRAKMASMSTSVNVQLGTLGDTVKLTLTIVCLSHVLMVAYV